jgi:hypothetical protein
VVVRCVVPLVPVTVTGNIPDVGAEQDRLVRPVPGSVTEVTEPQVRPGPGEVVKDTVPVNPFRAAIVILVVQLFPIVQGTVVGDAEIPKSGGGTVTAIVVFWMSDPLVPVMFTR